MQDRYKRVQKIFHERDAVERKMSGIIGEIRELREQLSSIKKRNDDFLDA